MTTVKKFEELQKVRAPIKIAKGSCREVQIKLCIANDFVYLKERAEETSKLINTFIKAVKSSQHKKQATKNSLDNIIEEYSYKRIDDGQIKKKQ